MTRTNRQRASAMKTYCRENEPVTPVFDGLGLKSRFAFVDERDFGKRDREIEIGTAVAVNSV